MHYTYHDSPVGPLLLAERNGSLTTIHFPLDGKRSDPKPGWTQADAPFDDVREQLDGYFAGRRRQFELPLAPTGTDFQRKVLEALQAIPYGETRSYKEVAAAIGKPRAVRAVGAANGRNPIPIIIPCHRVIGSDGSLTGFGGGLEAKRALLALEQDAGLFS